MVSTELSTMPRGSQRKTPKHNLKVLPTLGVVDFFCVCFLPSVFFPFSKKKELFRNIRIKY